MSVAVSGSTPDKQIVAKSWYSAAFPFVTAVLSSATKRKTNRINPVQNKQNKNQKKKINDKGHDIASTSIAELIIKKLQPKLSTASTSNSIASNSFSNWRKCLTRECIQIYFKSPYVVASGQLSGTIVIEYSYQGSDDQLHDLAKEIELSFVGVEAVYDTFKIQSRTHEFLNLKIDFDSTIKTNKLWISFVMTLPTELNGTYSNKRGSIEYYLQSKLENQLLATELIIKKQNVIVFQNMKSKSLRDAALFYTPINDDSKQLLRSEHGHVSTEISMPRTLWISGAPIYLSLKLQNLNLFESITDVKLQLVCQYEVQGRPGSSSIEELISSTGSSQDVLSQVSLANSKWWRPLEPNSKDCFTMSLDVPPNLFTVQNQKLLHVLFLVRVLIYSQSSSDLVAEIPITIAHPISLDPPPGIYTKSSRMKDSMDDCRPFVFQDDFKKQQKAIQIIDSDHSSYFADEPEEASSNVISSYSISTNPEGNEANSLAHLKQAHVSNPFSSLKKNINSWSSRLSRRISVPSQVDNERPTIPTMTTMLKISSPLISSASSVTGSHHDDESIEVCSLSPPSILNNSQQQQQRQQQEKDKSTMKFGQIKGPKCFGQYPDCLGDAGLDIRACFNVPTATEALQSYAAEKVEISTIPTYPEPVVLSDNFTWKEGLIAPPEKCEIDASMLISEDEDNTTKQLVEFKDKTKIQKYPSQVENQISKRMLASSRHLRNVQRKSAQVSRDGRPLLTISSCTA